MEKRINLVATLLAVATFFLLLRLGFWQVIKNGEFSRIARAQYLTGEEITAQRGSILASDGMPLAA